MIKYKFVVEVEADRQSQVNSACHDIETIISSHLKLHATSYGRAPKIVSVKVQSYNRLHRRKLVTPAVYEQEPCR